MSTYMTSLSPFFSVHDITIGSPVISESLQCFRQRFVHMECSKRSRIKRPSKKHHGINSWMLSLKNVLFTAILLELSLHTAVLFMLGAFANGSM